MNCEINSLTDRWNRRIDRYCPEQVHEVGRDCRQSGWSSPYSERMAAIVSGVARAPASRRAGSPGARCSSRKVTTLIPINTPESWNNRLIIRNKRLNHILHGTRNGGASAGWGHRRFAFAYLATVVSSSVHCKDGVSLIPWRRFE